MAAVQQKQQGYHHLETDDEVFTRLKKEKLLDNMSNRLNYKSVDEWLEAHNMTRKMVYVP